VVNFILGNIDIQCEGTESDAAIHNVLGCDLWCFQAQHPRCVRAQPGVPLGTTRGGFKHDLGRLQAQPTVF